MTQQLLNGITQIGVIGAGTMGKGIAQLALQAGHEVVLVDQAQAQLDTAQANLTKLFGRFVEKGKITAEQQQAWLDKLNLATEISELREAGLVIEAIVERMDVKQEVFATLEKVVSAETILATNTSSLSVTEIASSMQQPQRFLGLHFFNPPGVMPLVEVVNAIQTSEATLATAEALMTAWGKTPVRCKDTPSFIVNRVARPFYVESFRLLEENAVEQADLDASLREGMNFRMGPCELTDFIGQDVNYAVSESLWEALRYPKHLQPSFVQGELVAAKFLGRKTDRGFYRYDDDTDEQAVNASAEEVAFAEIHDDNEDGIIGRLENGVIVVLTNGIRAIERRWDFDSNENADNPTAVAVIDIVDSDNPAVRAIAYCPRAKALMDGRVPELAGLTQRWVVMPDRPGLINLRVLSLIINEAATAAMQGIADEAGIDNALKGGVNYPKGAFAWLQEIGLDCVYDCLNALNYMYPNGGYAPSPYLVDAIEAEEQLVK